MLFGVSNAVRNPEQVNGRPSDPVPAVAVAARILSTLARGDREATTLTELARELSLPKSTLHNQLTTLQAHGLVHRDDATRRYRLGVGLISLGRAAGRQLRAAAVVGERLPALAAEHNLTFAIAQVAEPREAVLVDCAYPADDMHVGLALGSSYGVFHGAVGKCLLAALDSAELERLLREREIPRHTGTTIVDPDRLLAEIGTVRERGWAASAGEFKENHAVAAPLVNPGGGLELIVFAVGFPAQLPVERFGEIADVLMRTAHQAYDQEGQ